MTPPKSRYTPQALRRHLSLLPGPSTWARVKVPPGPSFMASCYTKSARSYGLQLSEVAALAGSKTVLAIPVIYPLPSRQQVTVADKPVSLPARLHDGKVGTRLLEAECYTPTLPQQLEVGQPV